MKNAELVRASTRRERLIKVLGAIHVVLILLCVAHSAASREAAEQPSRLFASNENKDTRPPPKGDKSSAKACKWVQSGALKGRVPIDWIKPNGRVEAPTGCGLNINEYGELGPVCKGKPLCQ